MNVTVQFKGLNPDAVSQIMSSLEQKWPRDARVAFLPPGDIPEDVGDQRVDALLVIGKDNATKTIPSLISESVLIRDEVEEAPTGKEGEGEKQVVSQATLFEIDFKLGRLARSDLVKTPPPLGILPRGRTEVSRRDLFHSFRKAFQEYSDAPTVTTELCEARYGCTKCIQVCEPRALSIENSRVKLNEPNCVRCGLCAASCNVSAIQMPKFSDRALDGVLLGMSKTKSPGKRKSLVITCDSHKEVTPAPWLAIVKVDDVGVVGLKQLARVLSSPDADSMIVYCRDGLCRGKEGPKSAVEALALLASHTGKKVLYLEGEEGDAEIQRIHAEPLSSARMSERLRRGNVWQEYVADLRVIAGVTASAKDISTTGLGMTDVTISNTCTLCGSCVGECPHKSFQTDNNGTLIFDASTCTGCTHCASICPEHSITLTNVQTLDRLGHMTVFQDEIVKCIGCGKPLSSRRFMNKMQSILGENDNAIKYCSTCKQKRMIDQLTRRK